MISNLYPLEEHPHFCSFYWGDFNESSLLNTGSVAAAGASPTAVSTSYDGTLRSGLYEDPRIENLRKVSYGIALPIICALGIVGNVLNLVVLTRRNMRGTAYIYMRGYSAAALLAIIFAIPFGMRMLIHRDSGRWRNFGQAFYSAHLELFLGNGCLGVGVIMLLVLTIERYVSVCHPGHIRRMCPPRITVWLIAVLTFLIYLPSVLRGEIVKCVLQSDGTIMYHKRDNMKFLDSLFYSIYKVILEIVFKLAPTVLIAGFNLRIMIVYRRTCDKRRRMTLSRINTKDEDPRKYAEERRLMMLLGSTSLLFLICVSPMAILHVTLSSEHLSSYSFQLFRALANLLELINYSLTFYIYCLFSEDFRNTLFRTIRWPWFEKPLYNRGTEFPLKHHSTATMLNGHTTGKRRIANGTSGNGSLLHATSNNNSPHQSPGHTQQHQHQYLLAVTPTTASTTPQHLTQVTQITMTATTPTTSGFCTANGRSSSI
ncbi:probable G-protein coupled receptor B0563.6 [Topomyia yanbarensis]|uniref:probable G-protein coupled receptor B0563.6 n=1 Tax=Topomyia yanbarensis TaxID=2498891 RepID=UPI00273B7A4C|nr:probable G-protein coupled receptor B0563.6 [Topomyia yanbarensis]XP_058834032.1 probable G-protein coupled receptor B0563.6 [Topomyia yanbarensis]